MPVVSSAHLLDASQVRVAHIFAADGVNILEDVEIQHVCKKTADGPMDGRSGEWISEWESSE